MSCRDHMRCMHCKDVVPAPLPEVRASGPIVATQPEWTGSPGLARQGRAKGAEKRRPLRPGRGGYPADSDPSRDMGAAALGEVHFEIATAESQRPPNPEMGKPSGSGKVVDGGYGQPQQVRDLLGRQQLVIEWDDRVVHGRLRVIEAGVDGSGASSTIASAPTARAARCTASAIGGVAW
jgi:hypothetical protein